MKKNEIRNFIKQYKNTVCLDENLSPMKIVDCLEEAAGVTCLVVTRKGEQKEVPFSDKFVPLKGRLKERDYNYVEAQFHKGINNG